MFVILQDIFIWMEVHLNVIVFKIILNMVLNVWINVVMGSILKVTVPLIVMMVIFLETMDVVLHVQYKLILDVLYLQVKQYLTAVLFDPIHLNIYG